MRGVEDNGTQSKYENRESLSGTTGWVGKSKTVKSNAFSETRANVSNMSRVSVSIIYQV